MSSAESTRAQLEARVAAITERLLHLARKEAKREKRRGACRTHACKHTPVHATVHSLLLH